VKTTSPRRSIASSAQRATGRLAQFGALVSLAALVACGGNDNTELDDDVQLGVATAPASIAAPASTAAGVSAPEPASAPAATKEDATETLSAAVIAAHAVPAGLTWRGVNLAGAEFTASQLPGIYAKHYVYPSVSSASYFQSKGMNFVRLPFLWERLQPTLNSSLDTAELQRLKAFVDGATAKGLTVMIDPHSYGRYRKQTVGSAAVPNAAFADFWRRVAGQFKGNNKVVFGLMNEPYGMATETWVSAANAAIRSIRNAGAANVILVPGNAWTGAHSWNATGYGTANGVAMKQIVDPANNMLIEVHQYLDADSSGTSSTCTRATIGAERLVAFTTWLRANGKRGFLGEFAAADNSTCKQALAGMLAYMQANKDVWAGWSYWAAGPWWGSADMFSIEPTGSTDKPQMSVLQPYL